MRVLYVLPYSPWSERARWMLMHHGVSFEEREHVPMLGELSLRRAAKRWRGPVSVPLLVDGSQVVQDSLAIAEHVDARGGGRSLLPSELRAKIGEWNAEVEPIIDAQRAHGIRRVLDDPEMARAVLPGVLRGLPLAAQSSRLGSRYLMRKYGVELAGAEERERSGLSRLRAALGGRNYIFDRFSYADIIAATALHFVVPPEERYVPMALAQRRAWTHDGFAREFGDLLEWRDALYAKHRPPRQRG